MREVYDRKSLVADEFGINIPGDMPVQEFMYLSDKAYRKREDRRKAAQEGLIWHGS